MWTTASVGADICGLASSSVAMGRRDHDQRSQHSVKNDKTSKEKEKDKHKETPRRGRKREQSRSPSIWYSQTLAPLLAIRIFAACGWVRLCRPPSSPSLANLDNKLDKVFQLQLNAQARLSNPEKVMALHEVALKELGPINHSLAELSQRVEDVDLRLHQAEQRIASPSSTSVPTRPSSRPLTSLPPRTSVQAQGRLASVPRAPSSVRVTAGATPRPPAVGGNRYRQ